MAPDRGHILDDSEGAMNRAPTFDWLGFGGAT